MPPLNAALAGAITVPLPALLRDMPPTLEGGSLESCEAAPAALADVLARLGEAEAALSYLDAPGAVRALGEAEAALLCLNGPITASTAARAPFLRGVLAQYEGDPAAAEAHFRQALLLEPEMPWDPTFPPDVQARFDAAAAAPAPAPVSLRLLPGDPGPIWLNGRLVPEGEALALPPGTHYLQLPEQGWLTLRLSLGADSKPGWPLARSATLLLPAAFSADSLGWIGEPRQEDLAAALAAVLPAGTAVQAQVGEQTWALSVGEARWEVLPPPPPPRRGGLWLAGGGAALVVSGLTASALGFYEAQRAADETLSADTWAEYQRIAGRYDVAADQLRAGRWLTLSGAGLVGAGLTWQWREGW